MKLTIRYIETNYVMFKFDTHILFIDENEPLAPMFDAEDLA